MKLIIDIPKDIIESAKSSPNYYPAYHFEKIWRAIANGKLLPKGHGRLIDADEILNHAFIEESEEGDIFTKKYYCIRKEIMDNALVLFDTLEADPAESEGK